VEVTLSPSDLGTHNPFNKTTPLAPGGEPIDTSSNLIDIE
jgi:hypothetical protein